MTQTPGCVDEMITKEHVGRQARVLGGGSVVTILGVEGTWVWCRVHTLGSSEEFRTLGTARLELLPEPPKTAKFYPAAFREQTSETRWWVPDTLYLSEADAKARAGVDTPVVWPYIPGVTELPI
jgi:hypothetical protein